MWVARRNACINVCVPRRSRVPRWPLRYPSRIYRTPSDTWYHATRRNDVGRRAGEKSEKGEKRSEGNGGRGKMNRTGRPSISNSSCRSCYLLVSKGITCIHNSRVQSIPRPVFRFTNGYQKLRRMNFYSPERERERASSEVSSRESSFVVRDERHSVPGESIKFASYAIVRERISSLD